MTDVGVRDFQLKFLRLMINSVIMTCVGYGREWHQSRVDVDIPTSIGSATLPIVFTLLLKVSSAVGSLRPLPTRPQVNSSPSQLVPKANVTLALTLTLTLI